MIVRLVLAMVAVSFSSPGEAATYLPRKVICEERALVSASNGKLNPRPNPIRNFYEIDTVTGTVKDFTIENGTKKPGHQNKFVVDNHEDSKILFLRLKDLVTFRLMDGEYAKTFTAGFMILETGSCKPA